MRIIETIVDRTAERDRQRMLSTARTAFFANQLTVIEYNKILINSRVIK